jgi:hypothetical protein
MHCRQPFCLLSLKETDDPPKELELYPALPIQSLTTESLRESAFSLSSLQLTIRHNSTLMIDPELV